MDELVTLVSQKTGLSEEMSRMAVEIVIDYLKGKLPPPMSSQIDRILAGESGGVDDIATGLGSLLGK